NTTPGPMEDSFVGTAPTGPLFPGQCATVPVQGPAYLPPPGMQGAYHLGAVVDAFNHRPELLEDNNASSGYRIGVGSRPDFVITNVKGPTSVQDGQPLTAQVTVCNHGTQADDAQMELYLSADATIRPNNGPGPMEDSYVGNASTGPLYPGRCATVPIQGSAWLPPPGLQGAYHLGAVVDPFNHRPELIEDNNTSSGYRIGVGNRSDFVITSVTGPTSVQDGQPLTAQVKVCNQGTQSEDAQVELYLSADATIRTNTTPGPMEDSFVGTAPTGWLRQGQCATVPIQGPAWLPPPGLQGAYHLGAVVDPTNYRPELIEDNNTSSGYRIGVGNAPDFVITGVKGPTSVQDGQPLTAQVTVCNQGTQPSDSQVELYLSADSVIRTNTTPGPMEDSFVGTAPTGPLFPGQCATVPVQGPALLPPPGLQGAYHLGALVDPFNHRQEFFEDNNTSSGYRIGVGSRPDFVVTSVTGPTSVLDGQPLTAQVTVCNHGTQAEEAQVELYLSTDAAIRTNTTPGPMEDSLVGNAPTGPLYPGRCVTVPIQGQAWLPSPGLQGAYHLGAVVDSFNHRPELIEDNNASSGYRIGVGNRSDFVITSVTGPTSVQDGQPLTAQVKVCNQGTQSDEAQVELYLSADATIRTNIVPGPMEDSFVGNAATGWLKQGQCATVPIQGSAWLPPPGLQGAYHLGAVVDPTNHRPELIEDNNTSSGYRIGVGSRPDFVVTAVTGPYSVKPNTPFNASVVFCNRGQQSGTADVDLFLSADSVIRPPVAPLPPEDFYVGTVPGVTLSAGQCVSRNVSVMSPTVMDGAYHLGAMADPRNNAVELIEDNNTLTGNRMGVGNLPDFVVTAVTGPYSVRQGNTFSTSVTVCNRGQQSGLADVDLYLSSDNTVRLPVAPLPPEDFFLGTVTGISLNAGLCASRTLTVTAPSVPDGAWFLGAAVDPFNNRPEFIEDNNTLAVSRIGVGIKPDLVITSVTSASSVRLGAAFAVSFTVCNRGQAPTVADVDLFLSSDNVIRPPVAPLPPEDHYLGTVTGVSLNLGQCVTRSRSVNANAPTTGSWYVGASADTSGAVSEYLEDNNALAGTLVSVTP
ncbi:CARDB domain-containing protein, partial [Pyxidicoccus sp. 3LFB2]